MFRTKISLQYTTRYLTKGQYKLKSRKLDLMTSYKISLLIINLGQVLEIHHS